MALTQPVSSEPLEDVRHITGGTQGRLSDLSRDFFKSAKSSGSWFYTSWMELLLSYRSTFLGPLWISAGTAVFVFAVGNLYGRVMTLGDSNVYLAHLAVGMVIWLLLNKCIVSSCKLFSQEASAVLDGAFTYCDLLLKLLTTHLITLAHNVLVVIIAFLVIGLEPTLVALCVLLTLPLVVANLLWICVIASILGARYPDIGQIASSILRMFFFITPILWVPFAGSKGGLVGAAIYLNPFYYLIDVVRAPLVSGTIPIYEISLLLIALPIGWLAASYLYARTQFSIALWI